MNKITSCPNCGASIQHKYNHQCPYCKTLIDNNIELSKKYDYKYMKNVELREVLFDHVSYGISLLFVGDYLPYKEALEYGNKYMVLDYSFSKGEKMMFGIRLDYDTYNEVRKTRNYQIIIDMLPTHDIKEAFVKYLMNHNGEII